MLLDLIYSGFPINSIGIVSVRHDLDPVFVRILYKIDASFFILKDDTSLPEEGVVYFTRSELFNQLSAEAKFYVIKKK